MTCHSLSRTSCRVYQINFSSLFSLVSPSPSLSISFHSSLHFFHVWFFRKKFYYFGTLSYRNSFVSKLFRVGTLSCRNYFVSELFHVGTISCRNFDSSENEEVGFEHRPLLLSKISIQSKLSTWKGESCLPIMLFPPTIPPYTLPTLIGEGTWFGNVPLNYLMILCSSKKVIN